MVKALTTLSVKRHILSSYYMSFLARAVFSYLLIGKSFVLPFRCTTSSRNVKGLLIFRHLAGNGSSENLNSSKNSLGGKAIEFELHQSIDSIPGEEWNSFLGRNSSPFLEHSVSGIFSSFVSFLSFSTLLIFFCVSIFLVSVVEHIWYNLLCSGYFAWKKVGVPPPKLVGVLSMFQ